MDGENMKITLKDVENVALLSRLEFSETELEQYTGNLNDFLEYADLLTKLDTEGIKPTAHVLPIKNVFRKDDFIDIELTDFGGGIPDTTKDNLFEIFTTSKEYGTGLGLPIARQIIEDHSGRLLFESRPGDGCTFSILLPVNPGS